MPRYDRNLWRAALCLRDQLQRRCDSIGTGSARFAEDSFIGIERAQRLQRLLHKATSWRRHGAIHRLRPRLANELRNLHRSLDVTVNHLARPVPSLPSMRELLEELSAIEEEFEELHVDLPRRTLAVRTESIELEGLHLGPFEIRLFLADLADPGGPPPYAVVALRPHPAAGADHVTHPHVSDDRLCAGDATGSINRALEGGRLCDFFLLVRSVLTTYNPESPYVSIDEWDGQPCADCGARTHEDSGFFCEQCERDYCDECVTSCHCCDVAACHGCMSVCDVCGESSCEKCLQPCDECGETACRECREGGVCNSCSQDKETDHDTENQEDKNQEQQAASTTDEAQPRV